MKIRELNGKTIKEAKIKILGDTPILELLFEDETLLSVEPEGYEANLSIQINPDENNRNFVYE